MGVLGTRYFFDEALPALMQLLKMPLAESVPVMIKAVGCAIIISFIGLIIYLGSFICDTYLQKKFSITQEKLEKIYFYITIGIHLAAICGVLIICYCNE